MIFPIKLMKGKKVSDHKYDLFEETLIEVKKLQENIEKIILIMKIIFEEYNNDKYLIEDIDINYDYDKNVYHNGELKNKKINKKNNNIIIIDDFCK